MLRKYVFEPIPPQPGLCYGNVTSNSQYGYRIKRMLVCIITSLRSITMSIQFPPSLQFLEHDVTN